MRLGLAWCLLLAACTGPTVYLGRAPDHDAGPDAGAAPDDDDDGDRDDDDDDDDLIECIDDDFCDDGTPHCHPDRKICVECLEDDDCDRDERCTRDICRDN